MSTLITIEIGMTLDQIEQRVIVATLEHFNWNRSQAAHALNISIRTLRNKIDWYRMKGVEIPESQYDYRGAAADRRKSNADV